ncbi:MAG: hypothetical protein M9936_17015 [Caldilinea sp.]|nr:hypothetical protein [Caldilinea sp.]MCB0150459.1 hypothetical protein [Caldilineaceae bacterium]MCB9119807.1 hypothetical protein [Caldilineaceae bacterium]MCO5211395.1 hypothetical protein [Caldilinea sp.]MCW5844252.1 hypothetical protein [Caldilinea sp.]
MKATIERLPPSGRVEIAISVAADVNISAMAARQKVNDFVLSEISYMMHAGEPELVVSDRVLWRVPVILSLTSHGDVGEIGAISVDVESGQMAISPEAMDELHARADDLARRFSRSAAA